MIKCCGRPSKSFVCLSQTLVSIDSWETTLEACGCRDWSLSLLGERIILWLAHNQSASGRQSKEERHCKENWWPPLKTTALEIHVFVPVAIHSAKHRRQTLLWESINLSPLIKVQQFFSGYYGELVHYAGEATLSELNCASLIKWGASLKYKSLCPISQILSFQCLFLLWSCSGRRKGSKQYNPTP